MNGTIKQLERIETYYEDSHPKDRRRARWGSALVMLLVLIILIFPFFSTVYPFPESEGMAVAFGNVDEAGGGENLDPNPVNEQDAPPPEPTEEQEIPAETVEDEEAPPLPPKEQEKPKPNPTKPNPEPQPKPNPSPQEPKREVERNALFPGGGGQGTGSGSGQQGRPDGEGDNPLNRGTGRGEQGDGTGRIGNRRPESRCTENLGNLPETGTAWVFICVNEQGKVIEAEFRRTTAGKTSTISSEELKRVAERCAKQYVYPPAPAGSGTACGSIPIEFIRR